MWTITTALYNTHRNVEAAKATIPLIFIFFFFYDLAYTPLIVAYSLEILPFRVRAKGFAVMVSILDILRASFLTVMSRISRLWPQLLSTSSSIPGRSKRSPGGTILYIADGLSSN